MREKQAKTRDQRESQKKGQSNHRWKEVTLETLPSSHMGPMIILFPFLGGLAGRGNLELSLEAMVGVPRTTPEPAICWKDSAYMCLLTNVCL